MRRHQHPREQGPEHALGVHQGQLTGRDVGRREGFAVGVRERTTPGPRGEFFDGRERPLPPENPGLGGRAAVILPALEEVVGGHADARRRLAAIPLALRGPAGVEYLLHGGRIVAVGRGHAEPLFEPLQPEHVLTAEHLVVPPERVGPRPLGVAHRPLPQPGVVPQVGHLGRHVLHPVSGERSHLLRRDRRPSLGHVREPLLREMFLEGGGGGGRNGQPREFD